MSILVGYPYNTRAKGVMRLACMLARASGEDLVVCTVLPSPHSAGMKTAQYEQDAHIAEVAEKMARKDLPEDIQAQFIHVNARSVATVLIDTAQKHGASMIVVGSAMGFVERVTVSSIADRLLHSSPIPVAVSTRGFLGTDTAIDRVTLAFAGDQHSELQFPAARKTADALHARLRLASFAVDLTAAAGIRGAAVAEPVLEAWTTMINDRAAKALARHPEIASKEPELVTGQGFDWADALDDIEWQATDVMVVGSSPAGPLSRVFLGSRATKIMRNSPVPVIAIPRALAKKAASQEAKA